MKYFAFLMLFLVVACGKVESKNNDLISPCAGCDDRVTPSGNLKYTI